MVFRVCFIVCGTQAYGCNQESMAVKNFSSFRVAVLMWLTRSSLLAHFGLFHTTEYVNEFVPNDCLILNFSLKCINSTYYEYSWHEADHCCLFFWVWSMYACVCVLSISNAYHFEDKRYTIGAFSLSCFMHACMHGEKSKHLHGQSEKKKNNIFLCNFWILWTVGHLVIHVMM